MNVWMELWWSVDRFHVLKVGLTVAPRTIVFPNLGICQLYHQIVPSNCGPDDME